MSDEYVVKLRGIIDGCRELADSIDPYPTARTLREVAERLELNLVMMDEEVRQATQLSVVGS